MRFDAQSASTKLSRLEIPVPDNDTLEQINRLEGGSLNAVIDRALSGDNTAFFYLRGVFFTIMPGCKARLQQANLPAPSLAVLISLGKSEGPKFARNLKQWAEAGCPDTEQGQNLCNTYRKAHAQFAPGAEQPEVLIESEDVDSGSCEDVSSTAPGEPEEKKAYINRHVYGGKVAMCFQSDNTRSGEHTIRIEAAEATASKSYNWSDKVGIQLSTRELPGVLATFLQMQKNFEGKGHGSQNEKWFTLENQQGKVFISVNMRGKPPRSVPVGPGDCFGVVTLLIEQMLKNSPFLTADTLLSIIQRTGKMSQGA